MKYHLSGLFNSIVVSFLLLQGCNQSETFPLRIAGEKLSPLASESMVTNALETFSHGLISTGYVSMVSLEGCAIVAGTESSDCSYCFHYISGDGGFFRPYENLRLYFNSQNQLIAMDYSASGPKIRPESKEWGIKGELREEIKGKIRGQAQ